MRGKQGKIRRQRNAVKGLQRMILKYQRMIVKMEERPRKESYDRVVAQITNNKQAAELCLINTIRNLGGVN